MYVAFLCRGGCGVECGLYYGVDKGGWVLVSILGYL